MPSGHKAFLVHNPADVDLLLMHNKTFAAEYVFFPFAYPSFLFLRLLRLLQRFPGILRIEGYARSYSVGN